MSNAFPSSSYEAVKAISGDICNAFDDVKRDGGISWSECDAIDGNGTEEECAQARDRDKDTHWRQLLDDQSWQPFSGAGFSFIDAIGFRYYLPPTMIRFLHGEITEYYPGHLLGVINRFIVEGDPTWTPTQLQAIARFILFMAANDGDDEGRRTWETALKTRWIAHLPDYQSPYLK